MGTRTDLRLRRPGDRTADRGPDRRCGVAVTTVSADKRARTVAAADGRSLRMWSELGAQFRPHPSSSSAVGIWTARMRSAAR